MPLHDSLLIGLLKEGYPFTSRRAEQLGRDVFSTRVLFRKAFVARGSDAVAQFYAPGRITRRRAQLLPARILQDVGTVQLLDGLEHRDRKEMLMSLLDEQQIVRMTKIFRAHWEAWIPHAASEINLLQEVRQLLCQTACNWTGIALPADEVAKRTCDLALLVEGAGSLSLRTLRARYAHKRTLSWAKQAVRTGRMAANPTSPLEMIAQSRPLPEGVAAGEALNLLRPIVAVSHFVVFAAIALHEHPECADALDDEDAIERFVQEVRRFYPFFPLVAGRVLESFTWDGKRITAGNRIFLDLYGTNRHPSLWDEPHVFRPARFANLNPNVPPVSDLVPQGGGEFLTGHRCAGDRATVELMKAAVGLLRNSMDYDVPPQDLSFDLRKIPALPRAGMVLTNVRSL